MKYPKILSLILLVIILESCSAKNDDISSIKEVDQQAELFATYSEAMKIRFLQLINF